MLGAADLFCGAGGTTTGAEQSGRVKVRRRTAVQTHLHNHPDVRHICAEIDMVDPRDFLGMGLDVLLASPECVFHSNARGGKPVDGQRRATAWCVPRWAEVLRPKWIIVENVREFEDWAPLGSDHRPLKSKKGEIFTAWVNALRALNYHVEWRLMNAADYGGATKRVRLFVVARRGPSKKPIPWPSPTHARENWTAAATIIDWSRPCPSIFGRKRPLAEKTLRRIEIGLRKFCGPGAEPFIVRMRRDAGGSSATGEPLGTITAGGEHHALAMPFQFKAMGPFMVDVHHGSGDGRQSSAGDPLPTIVTKPGNSLVQPYLIDVNHGETERSPGGRVHSVDEPLGAITTHRGKAVVQPFIVPNFGEREAQEPRTHDVGEPLPTVTSHGAGGLVQPFLLPRQGFYDCRRDKPPASIEEPLGTVTANHSPAHVVLPFLASYFSNGTAQSVDEPLSTLTTKGRHGLAMVQLVATMRELGIIDGRRRAGRRPGLPRRLPALRHEGRANQASRKQRAHGRGQGPVRSDWPGRVTNPQCSGGNHARRSD